MASQRTHDYVERARSYAQRVIDGDIAACEWVRLACTRHFIDEERALKRNYQWKFSRTKANRICEFIEQLPHIKGRWKSATIKLEDWQCFILCSIFGWVTNDDQELRRFRKANIVVPRKNAKTTLAAGVGLYLLMLDGEPGAEIYSAATTRDQAKICWDVAARMVRKLPDMQDYFGVQPLAHSIVVDGSAAFFKPLSRDADSLEGLNVHGAIIDELHAHKTREVFDVLDDATGSRTQPLLFLISTEGDNASGVFAEQVAYGQSILRGAHQDDSYFFIFYGLDANDDWTLPESWRKANPNINVSVFESDLEVRCRQARANAESQASFLTKRCNVRVGASNAFFNMLAWDNLCCDKTLKPEHFFGQPCVMHFDLASKRDITSRVTMFRKGHDFYLFGKHYLPEDAIERGKPNYDIYRGWKESGWLIVTDGNITDFDFIESDLLKDMPDYKPLAVGVDPNYNAGQFTTRMLAEGVPMKEVPQNYATFSEAMRDLDALIVAGRIHHNGDPVLSWAMGNVIARKNSIGGIRPDKARDENKIDPAVSAICAKSLMSRIEDAQPSVYESRGLRVI
jgi:phage terminase large subunit-like protein